MSKNVKTCGVLLGLALIMSTTPVVAADIEYTYPMGKGQFSKPAMPDDAQPRMKTATPVSEYPTGKAGQRQGRVWDGVGNKTSHAPKTMSMYPTGKAGKR